MENLSTLEGKYGEEGDRLLFRILNSGEKLKLNEIPNAIGALSDKGLRYDLTVPFARFVAMNRNELVFPFKRFQVQPVWRADRPQKGRYREFYQCDADMIGSDSLLNEAELIFIIRDVFQSLNLNVTIKINNRKILAGIAEIAGVSDRFTDFTVSLDKLDKTGIEEVLSDLREKSFSESELGIIKPFLEEKKSTEDGLKFLEEKLSTSATGILGVKELQEIFSFFPNKNQLPELDLTLARGLNYYTGAIIEVKASDVSIGSVCGGGRYDNLTGVFGLEGISGVGISFGVDRIYDVMETLNLFSVRNMGLSPSKFLVTHFGEKERAYGFNIAQILRNLGIQGEVYPDLTKKISKQFDHASRLGIPFVITIGQEEMKTGKLAFKNMTTGNRETLSIEEIIAQFTEKTA